MDFLDNKWHTGAWHDEALKNLIDNSTGLIRITTGFVSAKALALLARFARDRPVQLLIGDLRQLQGFNENLDDVRNVIDWLRDGNVRVKMLYSKKDSWKLHSKVWIFDNSAVVTSANLTDTALTRKQPELGIVVRTEEHIRWLNGWYEKLWDVYPQETDRLRHLLEDKLPSSSFKLKFPRSAPVPSGRFQQRKTRAKVGAGGGCLSNLLFYLSMSIGIAALYPLVAYVKKLRAKK